MNKLQPDPQHPGPITTIASGLERIILPKGDTVDQDQPDLAQRANLGVHAADLVRLRSIEESERRTQGVGSRLRRTPLYLFLSSLFAAVRGIIFAFVTSPLTVFDNPIDAIYALTSYSVVYFALFWLQLGLFVIAVLRLEFFFNPASKIWGDSFSAANVWNPGMFDDLESVTAAKVKLGQGNQLQRGTSLDLNHNNDYVAAALSARLGSVRTKFFDINIARTFLLMNALTYERNDNEVKEAADHPETAVEHLISSEAKIASVSKKWGVRFTVVTDFISVSGAYAGAFYSDKDEKNPWIVLAFKGTSPFNYTEWIRDATFARVDANDFLWGSCHSGFYESLFPAVGSNAQILPARRIVESISTLGRMLHDASGKQVQLFFTGHSLGAGVASLAYCRALQGLDDPHLVLRDAYLFGCLSVGDANFLSGFEKLMHANANTSRSVFRVQNGVDIVASVPPGLAGPRSNRLNLRSTSLLNYGPIGIGIDLPKWGRSPFISVRPSSVTPGEAVAVVQNNAARIYTPPEFNFSNPFDYLGWFLSTVAPFGFDHAPTSYFKGLARVDGKSYPASVHQQQIDGRDGGRIRVSDAALPYEFVEHVEEKEQKGGSKKGLIK